MNYKNILNQPISQDVAHESGGLKSLVWINAAIYIIFVFLEPFDFKIIGYNKYLISLIFVFSYFMSLLVSVNYLLPRITALLKIKQFYFHHYLMGYLLLIIIVAITHQLVQNSLNGLNLLNFSLFYQTATNAFIIGLIPTVILTLIKYSRLLEKQLNNSTNSMTSALKSYPQSGLLSLESSNKKAILRFEKADILFVKSEDNYVNIYYLTKHNELKSELIRISMKKIQEKLEFPFLRVHRSYIVNLNQVCKVSGNSQGMQINLTEIKDVIPVSRTYIDSLKKSILDLP